jgi:hypothetical protein
MCLCCVTPIVIDWFGEPYILLREEKGFKLQKASDTHASLPTLLYALVFYSSVRDRLVSQSEVM